MAKGKKPIKQADPLLNVPYIYKRQLYGISDLDRTVRHKALSDIYEVLGLKTLRGRVSVTRDIFDQIDRYHIGHHAPQQSLAQQDKWFRDVAKHAGALAKLYREDTYTFGWQLIENAEHELDEESDPYTIFSEIAATAERYANRKPAKRGPDTNFQGLLRELGRTFFAETKKKGKLSRHPITGNPSGKFFKMVRAVCDLGSIDKTDEAIAMAIRKKAKDEAIEMAWIKRALASFLPRRIVDS